MDGWMVNVNNNKIKQIWKKNPRVVQTQKITVPEMQSRKDKNTFDTVKMKLSRFLKEMEKLWNLLEDNEQQIKVTLSEKQKLMPEIDRMENTKSDSQKQRQVIDISQKMRQWKTEMTGVIQRQRQDIGSKLAQVQSERDEIERIKAKLQTQRENIERKICICTFSLVCIRGIFAAKR